ncbi:MAG: D-beta-D-heptose 7-phosphate kinase/D-beta-D-heptose 1-phosphate adenosyltransferase [Pseudohongiellaceae bacterium]|jgi:D-beta-D-heptose 7-phosphate kinase/D-beta-D-heptose 1-phosphate adenosyltransferase
MSSGLLPLLSSTKHPRVLLVGDMILDRYQHGNTHRISPEAPIPVLAATHEELRLGGCGNVAANLAALGAQVRCVAVVGDDVGAARIRDLLVEAGCSADDLVVDSERPTICKTRLVSQNQQLLRIDEEVIGAPVKATETALLAAIEGALPDVDIVVVSDYGKGVLCSAVLDRLLRAPGRPRVLVDPKGKDYSIYRGASIITPNRLEAETATGLVLDSKEAIREAANTLCADLSLDAAIITLGPQGMFCRLGDGSDEWSIPSRARSVYDVTGAGDTVISVLAYTLALGAQMEQAMRLATVAAGVTVQRFGVAAITAVDIRSALVEGGSSRSKVLERADLLQQLASERARGRRVVFTNGCFDVLHVGHLAYLQESRSFGDLLVVGVNTDASVKRLKGPERPVNTETDRMALLAGLECVSFVTVFDDDTPLELIESLTPDVLVKGADWADKGVVGREWVEQHGGHVVLADLKDGYSTTNTLARVRKREGV